MDNLSWLMIAVAVFVFGYMVAWLIQKNSAAKTFTGNVDDNAPIEANPSPYRSNIAPGNAEEVVRALLDSGHKIEAIKRVREQTGLGLKEAKDLVDAMERGASVALQSGTSLSTYQGDADREARRLVAAGKAIEAIKLIRDQKNLGLKEAKDYVERL
jgi:ribosomal protein L7/L12